MIFFKLKQNATRADKYSAIALRIYLRYLAAENIGARMKYLDLLNSALMRCMVFNAEQTFGQKLREICNEK